MVYLKELDARGFVVYSNLGTSRKAADLATNPYASLCFWWKPVERQVRVEGRVERLTPEESQVYFNTRARGSRIGAWASQQTSVLKPQKQHNGGDSSAIDANNTNTNNTNTNTNTNNIDIGVDDDDGRAELEARVKQVEARFAGQEEIPVPPFWGGIRVIPETMEFWQGRESRLHDRFRYTRVEGGEGWKIERLSP